MQWKATIIPKYNTGHSKIISACMIGLIALAHMIGGLNCNHFLAILLVCTFIIVLLKVCIVFFTFICTSPKYLDRDFWELLLYMHLRMKTYCHFKASLFSEHQDRNFIASSCFPTDRKTLECSLLKSVGCPFIFIFLLWV